MAINTNFYECHLVEGYVQNTLDERDVECVENLLLNSSEFRQGLAQAIYEEVLLQGILNSRASNMISFYIAELSSAKNER